MSETPTIFVVSDGTCRTCEQVVKSVLVQFEGRDVQLRPHCDVRNVDDVVEIVDEAAEQGALIFYTLVIDDVRRAIKAAADAHLVTAVDLLGPALSVLMSYFDTRPTATPGLLYESEKHYFDRINAIDYTLKHDDGRRPHELAKADVVLVGLSRVSKSATCFYLAYRGIKAANVPLLPDRPPPRQLLALDPNKVIGLTISITRLVRVRQARLQAMGVDPSGSYVDQTELLREMRFATTLMAEHKWRTIDVSYKAIEEIAREVMHLLDQA